jgi:hypothetical protein
MDSEPASGVAPWRTPRVASATAPITRRAFTRKRWPSGVSRMPLVLRSNSGRPSASSSSSTLLVMADCAMLSMREAAATESDSATARK